MKRPVQALEIADNPEILLSIMLKKKQISVREGLRDYVPGKLIIYTFKDSCISIQVDITNVRHTTLAEITPEEMLADGYNSTEEMLNDLKSHYYPDITLDSPMTVISWNNIQGFWSNWNNIKKFAIDTKQEKTLRDAIR